LGARTIPVNVSFLQELLGAVAEQGRQLLPRSLGGSSPRASLRELAAALLSGRGEASGVAIASEILALYRTLEAQERHAFLGHLATMQPDPEALAAAAKVYLANPNPSAIAALQGAVESPRQEFFRRLNLAPGATAHRRAADLTVGHRLQLTSKEAFQFVEIGIRQGRHFEWHLWHGQWN